MQAQGEPEIRRHVVGQVLAHAVEAITGDGRDEEAFRRAGAENLRAGRPRLEIAVDETTPELQTIVRFLKDHTTPDLHILTLERRYVADNGVEILSWSSRTGWPRRAARWAAGR